MRRPGSVVRSASALAVLVALCSAALVVSAQDERERVVLWHAYGAAEEAGLRASIDVFERENRDVDVELVAVAFGAYASKLQAAVPVGRGPDVFIDAHDRLPSYLEASVVQPFGALDASVESDFDPAHLEALTAAGALLGVPLSLKAAALYVNDDLAAGADISTLEGLEALVPRLPEGTFALAWEADSAYASAALVHAYGAGLLDASGQWALIGPEAEAALAHLTHLVEAGVVPRETSADLVQSLFRSGRAVTAISGPWLAPSLPPELNWSVRTLPVVHAAGDRPMVPFATVEAAMLASRTEHASAARRVALFLAGPDGARIRAREGQQIVASRAAWDDPALASDAFLATFRDAGLRARPMSTHPHMRAVFEPAARAIRKILRGEMTVSVALAEGRNRFADETRPPPERRDPTLGIVALGLVLLAMVIAMVRRAMEPGFRVAVRRSMPAYAYVAHAAIAVGLLVILPLIVGAGVSFFAGTGQDLHYVGLANYVDILTARGGDLLGRGSFWLVLIVTVSWTALNIGAHVGIGVALALLLHRPALHMKGLYRVLLVLPWAVPSYVTALAWRGMFHRQFGAVNALLDVVGVEPISWFASFSTAFTANVTTNVWLGFPFMMVVTLGALTSIPKDVYEAAAVDGATRAQQFRHITLPLLRPALAPAVAMGAVWTFNQFNVVFLVSAGEPDGSTEILVSEAYRWAFTRGHQIGYAAAYAVLIFGLLWLGTRRLPGSGAKA